MKNGFGMKKMNINQQKEITNEVMEQIFPIDLYSIVAGGAPRDWYFHREASDIDIFLHRPDLQTSWSFVETFKSIGLSVSQLGSNLTNHRIYAKNMLIDKVFECEYKKLKFQFINMKEKTFTSVVPQFPLTICKAWYKNGEINTYPDFDATVKNNVIVKVNDLYADGDKYIEKIRNKFPYFQYFDSYESYGKYALNHIDYHNNIPF